MPVYGIVDIFGCSGNIALFKFEALFFFCRVGKQLFGSKQQLLTHSWQGNS